MTKLSRKQFNLARTFLKNKARGLECALYEYEFENGSTEAVVNEVKVYQNKDGGFGHALEPDFRCQESSTLATAIALHHLADVGVGEMDETVRNGVGYLLDTFNHEKKGWQIVPRAVENAPRAVWWNYSEDWEWGNPSAEIIGLLHHYRGLVPMDFLADLTQYAINYINDLTQYEQHELLSFIKLYEQLPKDDQDAITDKLNEMVQASVTTEPERWDAYCLTPLQVVSSPSSKFYGLFKEVIPLNLASLVQKQAKRGYWNPSWSWGQFEEEWKVAKEEWKGCLTLDHLRVLRAFDHVEKGTV